MKSEIFQMLLHGSWDEILPLNLLQSRHVFHHLLIIPALILNTLVLVSIFQSIRHFGPRGSYFLHCLPTIFHTFDVVLLVFVLQKQRVSVQWKFWLVELTLILVLLPLDPCLPLINPLLLD